MVNTMADNEKLSALMDGELVDKALICELTQDSESQRTWHHYHLIGDVIRGDVPQKEWNIADRVAFALESEASHSLLSADADLKENIVPLESQPAPQKAKRSLPGWLSHLGQISIAASVCFAVIIGIQHSSTSGVSPSQQALPILQTVPLAGVAEPVSLTRDSVRKQTVDINKQEQRRRINALLQDYELQLRLNSDTNLNQTENQKSVIE